MGAIASICAPLACCFTQSACKLCCSSCPGCRYSTSTRVAYSLTMGIAAIFSYICTTKSFAKILVSIKPLCNYYNTTLCEIFVGYEAVYRIQLSMAIFFALMCLLMINTKTSNDCRAMVQNGFWLFKVVAIIGITAGIFYIPRSTEFGMALMVIGIIASFIFILIQLILIIDFAHSWNETWVARGEDNPSWHGGLLTCVILMTTISIAAVGCMYQYLTKSPTESCAMQKSVISIHLIISVSLYAISITPIIQDHQTHSGVLQASCIFLYTTYLILSALGLNDSSCNQMIKSFSASNSLTQFVGIFSLAFTIAMIMYSSFRNAEQGRLLGLGSQEDSYNDQAVSSLPNSDRYGQDVRDDEENGVVYNYSLFHFLMVLSSLYLMMTITNWYNPTYPEHVASTLAAVWVKIVSSWVCQFLYLWTLVAPLVLQDRSFE